MALSCGKELNAGQSRGGQHIDERGPIPDLGLTPSKEFGVAGHRRDGQRGRITIDFAPSIADSHMIAALVLSADWIDL